MLLAGVITARAAALGHLQVDPVRVTIGARHWRALVPWDRIVDVSGTEINRDPVVMQWLDQVKAVRVESGSAQPSAYRMLASTTASTDAEITIIASRYAIDLPLACRFDRAFPAGSRGAGVIVGAEAARKEAALQR